MTATLKTAVTADASLIVDGATIDAEDVTGAIDDLVTQAKSGQMAVSANDTHVKHLEDAVLGNSGLTKVTKNDSGANETLTVDLDATGITSGYVPTANGSDGWGWGAVGGGGAQPVDVTGTAGEALSEREMVFLDESDGEWYKLDVDATGSVLAGALRGCVNESGGISSSATGSIRIFGEVSGFTGLTPWGRVYASTTAGGYTQTKPSVTDGGGQISIAEMGYALSSSIILIMPKPILYVKRETLANNGTMTIEHHSDAQSRQREVRSYIGTTVAGSSVASYSDSNQDVDVTLRASGSGGTETITASGNTTLLSNFRVGQSWESPGDGTLTEFTVELTDATDTVNWEIQADDNGGDPGGTTLASGSFSSSIGTNTINPGSPPTLTSGVTYWLMLEETTNAVRWQGKSSSTYADGIGKYSNNGGSSWSDYGDYECSFTVSAPAENDKIAQSFEVSGEQNIKTVDLQLKKVGSPTGDLSLEIQTDSGGEPSGTPVTNGTATVVDESTLSTSYGDITFTFATAPTLSDATTYWLVLSTDRSASETNYVAWGADGSSPSYADGEMMSEVSSTWSAESKDAVFEVFAEGTQYDEPCVIGRWSGGTRDCAVRFDDGSASDPNTKTTFKNVTGGSVDMVAEVEVA